MRQMPHVVVIWRYLSHGIVDEHYEDYRWYRVWSNGWCEQGGYTHDENKHMLEGTSRVSNYRLKVTLLKPYKSAKYMVFAKGQSLVDVACYNSIMFNTQTATGFECSMCYTEADGDSTFHYGRLYWEAKGFIGKE